MHCLTVFPVLKKEYLTGEKKSEYRLLILGVYNIKISILLIYSCILESKSCFSYLESIGY